MAIGSNNKFPKVILTEQGSTPSNPDSGDQKLFIRTSDNKLCRVNSAGVVTVIEGAGSGILNDGWIDKTSETWTYASADAPTFTFTISGDLTATYQVGQRIKLTQTTVKYFIIMKVEYSAPNTTVTIYGGTDYTLANAAISVNYYSPVKDPFGFPLDPTKWTVKVSDSALRSINGGAPVSGTWYNVSNPSSISIPIGAWVVSYDVDFQTARAANGAVECFSTLSTANNSESDSEFSSHHYVTNNTGHIVMLRKAKVLVLTSKTSYYLNFKTATASMTVFQTRGDLIPTVVSAVCAYL